MMAQMAKLVLDAFGQLFTVSSKGTMAAEAETRI
jgi:hypothetical protein